MYTGKKSSKKKKNIHREGKTFSIQLYVLIVSGDINIFLPPFFSLQSKELATLENTTESATSRSKMKL